MTEAKDLRDLAAQIEQLCREHPASSMAREAVAMLADYLCLRACIIELSRGLTFSAPLPSSAPPEPCPPS